MMQHFERNVSKCVEFAYLIFELVATVYYLIGQVAHLVQIHLTILNESTFLMMLDQRQQQKQVISNTDIPITGDKEQ